MHEFRRISPRIGMEALCWEIVDERETSAIVRDLSAEGARLERPFAGGKILREVPLQLEVPGIDEIMWARGDVVFDELVAAPQTAANPFGLVRRTGFHITIAAQRDLRLLRDFIYDMHSANLAAANDDREDVLPAWMSSCYARA